MYIVRSTQLFEKLSFLSLVVKITKSDGAWFIRKNDIYLIAENKDPKWLLFGLKKAQAGKKLRLPTFMAVIN